MPRIYAKSPQSGKEYLALISGETPTESEKKIILDQISVQEGWATPALEEEEELIDTDKKSTFGNLASGLGYGFTQSLASIPEGLAGLAESGLRAGFGYDPDSNQFGEGAEALTDYWSNLWEGVTGRPDDTVSGKIGQTFGSLASFLIPGTAVVKGASLLGAGVKTAAALGIGTASTLGSGLHSKDQLDRIAEKIESGQEIADDDQDAAVLLAGILGITEGLPVTSGAGRLLTPIAKIFQKVPADQADEAAKYWKNKFKSMAITGGVEGGQEMFAAVAQDAISKGFYDPDISLADSVWGSTEEGIYGGGAAAVLDLLIKGKRGSQVRTLFEDKARELQEDQIAEATENQSKLDNAVKSIMGKVADDDGTLLIEDKRKIAEVIREEGLTASEEAIVAEKIFADIQAGRPIKSTPKEWERSEKIIKEKYLGGNKFRTSKGKATKDDSIYYEQEDGSTIRDKKKGEGKGFQPVSEKTIYVTPEEGKQILKNTNAHGRNSDSNEGDVWRLEGDRFVVDSYEDQKAMPKLEIKYSDKATKGKVPVELFKRSTERPYNIHVGDKITSITPKPKSAYKLNQELDNLKKQNNDLNNLKKQLQEVKYDIDNFGSQVDQDPKKYSRLKLFESKLAEKIKGLEKSYKRNQAKFNTTYAKQPHISQPTYVDQQKQTQEQAEINKSRTASERATRSEYTDEYKRNLQKVANNLRKYLRKLGLVDVDLVTKNVITPDEIMDTGESSLAAVDEKSSNELFRKFGLPEGFEMEGTEGKRIITLAMELYDPNMSSQELEAKIKGVLNHEVVHSLRALGLFSKKEWDALVKSASKRKYVRIIDGKPVGRKYTYLDRAQVMYGNQKNMDINAIQEEAVAEMFRDFADGKLKVGGTPRTLWNRVKNFLASIWKAHKDAGVDDASVIFKDILREDSSAIGRRTRQPMSRRGARASLAKTYRINFYHSAKDIGDYGKRSKSRTSQGYTVEVEANSLEEAKQKLRQLPVFNNSIKAVERMLGSFAMYSTTPRLVINDIKEVGIPSDVYENLTKNEKLYSDGLITLDELNEKQPVNKFSEKDIKASLIKGIDDEGNKKDLDIGYQYIKPTQEFYDQLSIEDIPKLSDTNLENLYDAVMADNIETVTRKEREEGFTPPKEKELVDEIKIRRKKISNQYKTIQSLIDEDPEFVASDSHQNSWETIDENPDRYGRRVDSRASFQHNLAYDNLFLSSFDSIFIDRGLAEKGYKYDYSSVPKAAILAFHGSPYSFEQFLISKLGTGEGNQAFGWGLYFSDAEGIAEGYSYLKYNNLPVYYKNELIGESDASQRETDRYTFDVLNIIRKGIIDKLSQSSLSRSSNVNERIRDIATQLLNDMEAEAKREIRENEKDLAKADSPADKEFFQRLVDKWQDNIKAIEAIDENNFKVDEPSVYKVSLDTIEDNLINYDVSVEDQNENVLLTMNEFVDDLFDNPDNYNLSLENITADLGIDLGYEPNAVEKAKEFFKKSMPVDQWLGTFESITGIDGFAEKNLAQFMNSEGGSIDGIMFDSGRTRGKVGDKQYKIRDYDGRFKVLELSEVMSEFMRTDHAIDVLSFKLKNKAELNAPLSLEQIDKLEDKNIIPILYDSLFDSLKEQAKKTSIADQSPLILGEAVDNFYHKRIDEIRDKNKDAINGIDTGNDYQWSSIEKMKKHHQEIIDGMEKDGAMYDSINLDEDLIIEEIKPEHNYIVFDDAIIDIEEKRARSEPRFKKAASIIPINDPKRNLTILDRVGKDGKFILKDVKINPKTGQPIQNVLVTDALKKLQDEKGNVDLTEMTNENFDLLSTLIAAEGQSALKTNKDALGWYDRTLKAAKEITALIHPEIKTDKDAEHAYDFATAVTSNGVAAVPNWQYANIAYEHWKKHGLFEVKGYGKNLQAMEKSFKFYNILKQEGLNDTQIRELFSKKATRKELLDIKLSPDSDKRLKDLKIDEKELQQELMEEEVYVSFLFGAKIGQGFYQNLRGNYDPLTMDVWFMRMWNRLVGRPFAQPKPSTIENNKQKLRFDLFDNPKAREKNETEAEKIIIDNAIKESNITRDSTDADLIKFAHLVRADYQSHFTKVIAKQDQDARPEKSAIILSTENLWRNTTVQEQADPKNATERQWIRKVFSKAADKLDADVRRFSNEPLTIADFQALMWFAEKRLLASMGVRKGQGSDNDYLDASIILAQKKGITNEQIAKALPTDYRDRLSDTAVKYRGDARGSETTQKNVLEKRQETDPIGDPKSEVDLSEALTPEQNADLTEARAVLAKFPKASLVATSPFSLLNVPIKYPKYPIEFGYIYDGSSRVYREFKNKNDPVNIVIFPEGRTTSRGVQGFYYTDKEGNRKPYTDEEGNPVNFGLDNIIKKGYDKSLIENSNYVSPEKAVYDIMRKWQEQDYRDGEAITSGGNWGAAINQPVPKITLTYNNPPKNSVPLDLNLIRVVRDNQRYWMVESLVPQVGKRKASLANVKPSMIRASILNEIQQNNTRIMYGKAAELLARILNVPLKLSGFYSNPELKSKEIVDKLLIKFQDSMLSVGQMLDTLRKNGMTITDAMDTYLKEELYHGIVGDRISKNEQALYTPLAQEIKKINLTENQKDDLKNTSTFAREYIERSKIPELSIADIYLYALHAKERNKYIEDNRDSANESGSGMTNDNANAILNWFHNLPSTQQSILNEVSRKVQEIVANTNSTRLEGGLIPDFSAQQTDSDGLPLPNYTNYVPLSGKFDIENEAMESMEAFDTQFGIGRARARPRYGASGREDRRALGRSEDSYGMDIIASVMMQNQNAIVRSERNKVGQSFLDLIESDPERLREFANILRTHPMIRGVSPSGVVKMIPDQQLGQNENVLTVKRDGKEYHIYIADKRIAKAMKGTMNPQQINGFVKVMAKVNRYIANINTSWSPEFVITNLVRDLQTAGVNIQQYDPEGRNNFTTKIIGSVPKAIKGIKSAIDIKIPYMQNDPNSEWALIYKDYVANGGQNALNQMGDLQDQINSIDSIVNDISKSKKLSAKAKRGWNGLTGFLESVNTAAENGVRVATYKALIDSGMSKPRAAQAARNVTVNFSKGGDNKSLMNAMYLFYNASLQGSFALMNAAVKSPRVRKMWAGVMLSGFLWDQVSAMLSDEDEETGKKKYDKIQDYILEHNIVIPYGGKTGDEFFKIPMPYGLNMAYNLGRVASRTMRGEYTAGKAISSALGTIVDTVNPLGGTPQISKDVPMGDETVWNFLFPTIADPIVDVFFDNKDYKGAPIAKEASPFGIQQPDSERYWQTTDPSAKFLANWLNKLQVPFTDYNIAGGTSVLPGSIIGIETSVSPDVLQYWFDFGTGGLGRFFFGAYATGRDAFGLGEGWTEDSLRKVPFARRLVGKVGDRADTGEFIEGRDDVLLAFKELKEAQKAGDQGRYDKALKRFAPQLTIVGKIKGINNARNRLVRKRNEIRKHPRINEERKRLLIERINEKINQLTKVGNSIMREAEVI